MKILMALLVIAFAFSTIKAQSFKEVVDPQGQVVKLKRDSSHLFEAFNHFFVFALDSRDGKRNVLMFNGDTSFWLFNQGFDLSLSYSDFVRTELYGIPGNRIWFRIGTVWYATRGTPATTSVFNDANDNTATHIFLQLFNFRTGELGIEAIEKNNGDTLTLIYNPQNQNYTPFVDEFGENIKVIEMTERFGSNESKDFIGAQFNPMTHQNDIYGLYNWTPGYLRLLVPLDKRDDYDISVIYKDLSVYQFVVDRISADSAKVYEYKVASSQFEDVTNTVIANSEVIDAYNLPSVHYDGDLNAPFSTSESIWKVVALPLHTTRYWVQSLFEANKEINELRQEQKARFMFESVSDDSIYFYNYGDLNKGLVKYNLENKAFVQEPSNIDLGEDFVLKGWKGKMYFARYDDAIGEFVAAFKDFYNGNTYGYIEDYTGAKISNPIDFSFLDDKLFIHSKQDDSVILVYFDPTTIVSNNELHKPPFEMSISPNPASNELHVVLNSVETISTACFDIKVTNALGEYLFVKQLVESSTIINVSDYAPGVYNISIGRAGTLMSQKFIKLNY
jgi:hypothetical protein